ncbi:B3 domain-containing protein At2g33720-like [Impatiens glandulifera]|uniref:B3 domain-containing protein At2g33720-like n=1 Tax=Impatiens glandulifera TaxID=253017 RepID=UPI001FB17B1D|nr:B3 domain-containing protein At2g33720-like [Impatiens glandulifera]
MSSHLFQLSTLSLFPEEAGDVMKKKRLIGKEEEESNDQRPKKNAKTLSLICWEEQTSIIKSSIQLLPLEEEENVDGGNQYPWTITKKLYKSDVDSSSRLLLNKKEIESHVIPYLKEEEVKSLMFGSAQGIRIGILDVQKQQGFTLTLKKWKTGSFVFNSNWRKDFVKRRGLLHRDEIGLYFDQHNRRLCFGVLHKAPPHALPAWPIKKKKKNCRRQKREES